MSAIRLDNFGDAGGAPVDPRLYAVITPGDIFATGPWNRAAATIEHFPGSGKWMLDIEAREVVLTDTSGSTICRLLSIYPGTDAKDGVASFTYAGLPYSLAKWHLQN